MEWSGVGWDGMGWDGSGEEGVRVRERAWWEERRRRDERRRGREGEGGWVRGRGEGEGHAALHPARSRLGVACRTLRSRHAAL